MPDQAQHRLYYLRRLTDRTGLSRGALFGEPGGLAGYATLDNATALRLTTRLDRLGLHDDAGNWGAIYLQFLFQAFRGEATLLSHREALGNWSADTLGAFELAQAAQGLAAASASNLPGTTPERADALWNRLVPDLSAIRCLRTASAWLIAIAERPPAAQRKMEDTANRLAAWMVEQCYYTVRSGAWEWPDEQILPVDACLPHGLWAAYAVLGEERYGRIARTTTDFLVERLFEGGMFTGIGTRGGWSRHAGPARFDQEPAHVAATIELLCTAADVTGRADYAEHARCAQTWFDGNNLGGVCLLDDTTGGVYDALTECGHATGQGASAVVSYLLAAAALHALRPERHAGRGDLIETA